MLIPKKIRKHFGWYIGADEHVALEQAGNTAGAVLNVAGVVVKLDNYLQN